MVSPDDIVKQHGETVTLVRVMAAVFTDDALDESKSSILKDEVRAVASAPSEKQLRAFQGRQRLPTLVLTVPSGTDVRVDRTGRPDRVVRGGVLYQVEEVRDDRHPLTNTRKKTVYLAQLPGR